ncbi:flagellar assembly protein FliW [Neobacillus terrae]|uniref:flagellar assembly protein FliW n=1 Tax=Neobacillus terrae TaxID=3034837 RepID=UPI0014098757|nr:flagellar assembly protein FliW [Neobacillus terrae]NHM29965.1 flagellar assembly protein FliW [Neobacillus terrae]
MIINTKYHGELEINQGEILHFEKGVPGFPDEKKFIMLPLSDKQTYLIMQSVLNSNVAFVVTSPFNFFPDYDFELENSAVEELELASEKEIQVYTILTVSDPFKETTANLQAPIIINNTNLSAKQVILNDGKYKTKHPIFPKG